MNRAESPSRSGKPRDSDITHDPDLVITGGNVIDPSAGLSGELDVAVRGGRIAAVGKGIAERYPKRALNVSGALVMPGLVDIHTHCFWGGTYFGIRPDPVAGSSGVTTWVDAGSSGAWNLAAFRQIAQTSRMKIRAFINISAVGLVARTGELDNLEYCNESDLVSGCFDA